jgi:uncharacterized membrane protein
MSEAIPVFADTPRIAKVEVDRPWSWLARGWEDLRASARVSLAYGALAVAASFLLVIGLRALDLFYLILPFAAGFMLVGPLAAVGLYEVSRRRGAGEPVTLLAAVTAWRRHAAQIGLMGVALLLLLLFWIRLALLIFALFFGQEPPPMENFVAAVFFAPKSLPFLVTGTVLGGVLAAAAFSISAVSIPMLLDRDVNVFAAIATSVAVVRHNIKAMALWAALIVFFTGIGLVTAFLGLAVTLPLIGHATWHAYKDLVLPEGEPDAAA